MLAPVFCHLVAREAKAYRDCRRKGLHHNKLAQPGHPEGMAEEHRITLTFDDADEYRPEPPPAPEIPAWKDGSIRIGIHTSIAGEISGALEIAHGLGANALQIFSANPRMWARGAARISEADASRFRGGRREWGLGPLVLPT